jgi:hypothetical protein
MTSGNPFPSALRSEIRLLLDCSRLRVPTTVADRIRRIARSSLNWDQLTRAASWHGVVPLLCYNLNRLCADAVPLSVLRDLQARFRTNSTRNLSLAAELLKVLQFLEKNRIEAVPFKGPALAIAAYGNLALRQFYDLDVLVKEKDFPKAKELFLTHGYQPWRGLTPLEEAEHFRSNHAYTLVRSQDGLRLDLHWRITQERYAFGLDVESLWNRITSMPFCGRDVLSMSTEDLLIVLCLHGSKHNWYRLAWICDVAEVMRANPELRWDEIMGRINTLHIARAVLLGLDLAGSLLDTPLPEQVSSAIRRDRGVRRVSSLIKKRLFARSRNLGPLESAVLFFMTRERLQNQVPHLLYSLRRAVTPNEADARVFSLPDSLYFLYYPLRAMRLINTAVERLFSRAH